MHWLLAHRWQCCEYGICFTSFPAPSYSFCSSLLFCPWRKQRNVFWWPAMWKGWVLPENVASCSLFLREMRTINRTQSRVLWLGMEICGLNSDLLTDFLIKEQLVPKIYRHKKGGAEFAIKWICLSLAHLLKWWSWHGCDTFFKGYS